MTTPAPVRLTELRSSQHGAISQTPPGSPGTPVSSRIPSEHPSMPPHRPRSSFTGSTVHSNRPPSSLYSSRRAATRSIRTTTISRISGDTSQTPRTRLARGGPPRASVRERPRPPRSPPDPPTLVRYHYSTLILICFYIPLLIIPWVLICILDVKPLTWYGTNYASNQGEYTPDTIEWVPRWTRGTNILESIAAALAVPLVSSVLKHSAVALAQRTRDTQKLNARELLALADECWMRLAGDRRTWLATAGTTLIVLGESLSLLQHCSPQCACALWSDANMRRHRRYTRSAAPNSDCQLGRDPRRHLPRCPILRQFSPSLQKGHTPQVLGWWI